MRLEITVVRMLAPCVGSLTVRTVSDTERPRERKRMINAEKRLASHFLPCVKASIELFAFWHPEAISARGVQRKSFVYKSSLRRFYNLRSKKYISVRGSIVTI